jgi:hypothetical protein
MDRGTPVPDTLLHRARQGPRLVVAYLALLKGVGALIGVRRKTDVAEEPNAVSAPSTA